MKCRTEYNGNLFVPLAVRNILRIKTEHTFKNARRTQYEKLNDIADIQESWIETLGVQKV